VKKSQSPFTTEEKKIQQIPELPKCTSPFKLDDPEVKPQILIKTSGDSAPKEVKIYRKCTSTDIAILAEKRSLPTAQLLKSLDLSLASVDQLQLLPDEFFESHITMEQFIVLKFRLISPNTPLLNGLSLTILDALKNKLWLLGAFTNDLALIPLLNSKVLMFVNPVNLFKITTPTSDYLEKVMLLPLLEGQVQDSQGVRSVKQAIARCVGEAKERFKDEHESFINYWLVAMKIECTQKSSPVPFLVEERRNQLYIAFNNRKKNPDAGKQKVLFLRTQVHIPNNGIANPALLGSTLTKPSRKV